MRALVALCVLAALLAAALLLKWWPSDAVVSPGANDSAQATARTGAGEVGGAGREAEGAALVVTRAAAAVNGGEGLADAPTACLEVVEHGTQQPVGGAGVRRVQGGAEIAFTDPRGLASVPLKEPEQLAVVADGFLLRLVPTRLGSTEADPQRVPLVRDLWSARRRLRFVDADGQPVAEAFVRFHPRTPSPRAAAPVPGDDPISQRAWFEHTMLAGLPVCADVPVQLGSYSAERVHRLANGTEMRFSVPGEFSLEAATTGGLVARHELAIASGDAAAEVLVTFTRGAFAAGTIQSLTTSLPLAGAEITVQGGEPLGLVATSGADGGFRIGPLAAGPVTVHVRHGEHEPQAFGPVQVPADGVHVLLQPLPQSVLRGRVRVRPDLQPLAGATVIWSPSAGAAVTATTAADGTFVLRATGSAAARLAIQAPRHAAYAELVEPGAPFADYDLWPATTDVRLDKKLTALFEGIVVDASGRPQASVGVRWHPAARAAPAGIPGRRVLEGAALDLPMVTTTREDGTFALETQHFGPGKLALAETGTAGGLDLEARPGTTTNGLRLQR